MKAQKFALLGLAFLLGSSWDARATNAVLYVYPGQSDLTSSSSFSTSKSSNTSTAPATTSDVEFFSTSYNPSAFTLNSSENWGTLNDLSGTTITIDNKSSPAATDILTLSGGSNTVSGTATDYIYVASSENLSIGGSSTAALAVDLGAASSGASGNIHSNGTLVIAGPLLFNGSAANRSLSFTGSGNTTVSGTLTTDDGNGVIVNSSGIVTFSGGIAASTTLTAGTVDLTSQLTGSVAVNGGTFSESSAGNVFGGSVTFTVSGGTATLATATNSYGGATAVNSGGTLLLMSGTSIANSSGVTIAGGGTIGTPNTDASALTISFKSSAALTLNLGSSTSTQSNLALNLYSTGSDRINATTLTLNNVGVGNTVLITLSNPTNATLSTTTNFYELLTWTSPASGTITASDFSLAAGETGSLTVTGDDLFFTYVASVPEPSTWAIVVLGLGLFGLHQRRRGQLKAEAKPDSIPLF